MTKYLTVFNYKEENKMKSKLKDLIKSIRKRKSKKDVVRYLSESINYYEKTVNAFYDLITEYVLCLLTVKTNQELINEHLEEIIKIQRGEKSNKSIEDLLKSINMLNSANQIRINKMLNREGKRK